MEHLLNSSPARQSESLGSCKKNGGGDFDFSSSAARDTSSTLLKTRKDDTQCIVDFLNDAYVAVVCFEIQLFSPPTC